MTFTAGGGEVVQRKPVAYQNGPERREIPVDYIAGGPTVRLRIGPHNPKLPLIIDPIVAFAVGLGGSLYQTAFAIARNSTGIYLAGETSSQDFPISLGSSGPSLGTQAFVAKLDDTGSTVLYATLLGGIAYDTARGIAVDASGNAYVTGYTVSSDFPVTAGAYRIASRRAGRLRYEAFAVRPDQLLHISRRLGNRIPDRGCPG